MQALEDALGNFFVGTLPAFPEGFKTWLQKWLPILFIVFAILGLVTWLFVSVLAARLGALAFGFGGVSAPGFLSFLGPVFTWFIIPVQLVLELLGGIQMRGRKIMGWRLAFYSVLVGAVFAILNLAVTSIIFTFFELWALFQIRDYYASPAPEPEAPPAPA